MQGLGLRVYGAGFKAQGLGCRVWGAGFRVQGLGFKGFGTKGSRIRV